jgi:hypothetical protein
MDDIPFNTSLAPTFTDGVVGSEARLVAASGSRFKTYYVRSGAVNNAILVGFR